MECKIGNRTLNGCLTVSIKSKGRLQKLWVFLGVAETIVCSLLFCGVGVVRYPSKTLYDVIW